MGTNLGREAPAARLVAALVVLSLGTCAGAGSGKPPAEAPALPAGFWEAWGDGRAELNGYRLTTPRYASPREGYAVLVFVTETFTADSRVKSDGFHDDEFPVMKLNDIRHFQTGIYDYSLMTSVFARLDGRLPAGVPTKVSFGSQEWCGNLFDQVLVDEGRFRRSRRSYFDGEADADEVTPLAAGTAFADALPLVIRGFGGPLPHAPTSFPLLPTLADVRLNHGDLVSSAATLERDAAVHRVTVPAGEFDVRSTTLRLADGSTTTWDVEAAAPNRIIGWRRSDGEIAVLTGSTRRAYWEDHDPGEEVYRKELGIP